MSQKRKPQKLTINDKEFLWGGIMTLVVIVTVIAVSRGPVRRSGFLGSLVGRQTRIPDVAAPSVEIFRSTPEGIMTMPSKKMRANWLGQNDLVFITGGVSRNYGSALGSFARYYDTAALQNYSFLIMAKQNPFMLMREKGLLAFLGGMAASDDSFCEVPQKAGGKSANAGLYSLCNLDACNRQDGADGEEPNATAYERARGLVSEDVGSGQPSLEEHNRRVVQRYEEKQEANRHVQDADKRAREAERAFNEAESDAEMGLATPAEVQEKKDELRSAEAERQDARTEARAALDALEDARKARDEARKRESEEQRHAGNEAESEESDGWDDDDTSCVDFDCGSPLHRAQRYLRYLTQEDVEQVFNTGYADPPENAPESYIVPEHERPTGLDVLGQPHGDQLVLTPADVAGAIDVCSGLYTFMTANMQVCDPSPEGEGRTPSCSRGFGANALQIPFGALMMMK